MRVLALVLPFSFSLLMASFSPAGALAAEPCPLPQGSLLHKNARGFTLRWDLQQTPQLSEAFSPESYRAWVESHTAMNARELLANNIKVGQQIKRRLKAQDNFRREIDKAERNVKASLVLGLIRPMSCLESLPFRTLLGWVDVKTPTEFSASILARGDTLVVIADFYREEFTGAVESSVTRRLKASLKKKGFRYLAHLHNHPFNFDNPYGDVGGGLAPSSADIGLYQNTRPDFAWITNGLDTVILPKSGYSRLEP